MVQRQAGESSRLQTSNKRRSVRFALGVPLDVAWQADNVVARETAETLEVNVYGAVLRMATHPPAGTRIELTNRLSQEVAPAQVTGVRPSKPGGVAVELLTPSETFWGVTYRLKKAATDLRVLEDELKSGGSDPRVLQEFRDAVDHVRKSAWAVYEWQDRQLKNKDAGTVLSLLTTERMRRATQLNETIVADLNASQLTPQTPGIAAFAKAVRRIWQRLKDLGIESTQE
ncbi:MAG: hypothetical protein LAN59_02440 [Acidobacteriia bacterium]|nr:hypothetical protein [Terriglobia bacterium]